MQNITMYVAAAETLGVVRDSANAKNVAAPTLVRGCPATLVLRLFAGLDSDTPYPIGDFAGVEAWQFVMDSDFNSATAYKVVADRADIVVESVTEGGVTYTQFTIPITNMNTNELEAWLRVDPSDASKGHVESKGGMNAELVGFDGNGDEAYVLQIKGFTFRSRITSLGNPTEITPEYYTAAQVDAIVNGRLLGDSPGEGDVMVARTVDGNTQWVKQNGSWMKAVTGDFTALPGTIYTITLTQNKTIYIESGANTDYDFWLLVTQGATAYTLSLQGDMNPLYFADNSAPPNYAAGNTQPSVSTANTAYMFEFHWDSVNHVLLGRLKHTVSISS